MAASLQACRVALVHHASRNFPLSQFSRWYARGFKRTPVAVRTSEDDIAKLRSKGIKFKDPKLNHFVPFVPGDPVQAQFLPKAKVDKRLKTNLKKQTQSGSNLNLTQLAKPAKTYVTKSGLHYEKLEEGDKRFGRVVLAAKSRKERDSKKVILLEGRRLIVDALQAGAELKHLYFSDVSLVSNIPRDLLEDADLYKVQYRHLKLWADTETPSGILGIFSKPKMGEVVCPQQNSLPLVLICDNIRDPGNMGSIIRTAAAAGCSKIITTKGCVDIWDSKVLRGGMGGHFYTCILNSLPWEEVVNYVSPASHVFVSATRKTSVLEKSLGSNESAAQLLLNTSSSESESSSDDDEDDSDDNSETDEEDEENDEDSADLAEGSEYDKKWNKQETHLYKRLPLTITDYTDMDCADAEEVVVIVGGETEGVSPQAKKLAFDSYGQFVTIPMVDSVDSLNVATATAIVLYEVRRQLTSSAKAKTLPKKKSEAAN